MYGGVQYTPCCWPLPIVSNVSARRLCAMYKTRGERQRCGWSTDRESAPFFAGRQRTISSVAKKRIYGRPLASAGAGTSDGVNRLKTGNETALIIGFPTRCFLFW